MNVALYGAAGKRWAMTERGRGSLERGADRLRIGPSSLAWDGEGLLIRCDEITAPWPSRIRGEIRVQPNQSPQRSFELDAAGRHRWTPIAPCARVSVQLEQPRLDWQGHGYWDSNSGSEPLEDAFLDWDWSRTTANDHSTTVFYDPRARSPATATGLALRFTPDGDCQSIAPPPRISLARTGWRVSRVARAEDSAVAVEKTLEDTPFYARSLLTTTLGGQPEPTIHETLSLERFRMPVVQWMLPFRMPRRS